MGFAILLAFAAYLAVLVFAVRWAMRRARVAGKSPLLWGGTVAAAIVLPVFWDWLPTILVHRYYCATKTYARVYKTAEQWRAEHAAEINEIRQTPIRLEMADGIARTRLNSRFALERESREIAVVPVRVDTYRIVDLATRDVMAESNQFGSGHGSISVGGKDWRVVKFWLTRPACGPGLGGFGHHLREFGALDGRLE